MPLKTDAQLEASDIVANCCMNRERKLSGTNSYAKELRTDLLAFLTERLSQNEHISWLDLACGSGAALIGAAEYFASQHNSIRLEGMDLVDAFSPTDLPVSHSVASLHRWQPERNYTLITCVHGLHYVGDKIQVMQTALSALEADGCFLANLDHRSLVLHQGSKRRFLNRRDLDEIGLDYQARHRIASGRWQPKLPSKWTYLGADDQVGPNYTGQPAVTSHYSAATT